MKEIGNQNWNSGGEEEKMVLLWVMLRVINILIRGRYL